MARRKKSKVVVGSLKDVVMEYSETCDVDHIYVASVGGAEYEVSARYGQGCREALVLILGDADEEVGYAKVSKDMRTALKTALLAYLSGRGIVEVKGNM